MIKFVPCGRNPPTMPRRPSEPHVPCKFDRFRTSRMNSKGLQHFHICLESVRNPLLDSLKFLIAVEAEEFNQ